MHTIDVVGFFTQALYLVLWISLPPIVVGSVVGVLFSLLQALTQIQEQTLSFGVKLIAVSVTLFLTAGWMGDELYNFSEHVFEALPRLGH